MENKLLVNLSTTFKDEFYEYSKQKEFIKGSSPFFPDDLLKYFYVVVDGKIKTYQFKTQKPLNARCLQLWPVLLGMNPLIMIQPI